MDIDEVAERIAAAGSSAEVMPGFLPVLIDVDEADPMVTVRLGSLLDIDLRPVGDWSNYGFFCGGFSLEEMPSGVGDIRGALDRDGEGRCSYHWEVDLPGAGAGVHHRRRGVEGVPVAVP